MATSHQAETPVRVLTSLRNGSPASNTEDLVARCPVAGHVDTARSVDGQAATADRHRQNGGRGDGQGDRCGGGERDWRPRRPALTADSAAMPNRTARCVLILRSYSRVTSVRAGDFRPQTRLCVLALPRAADSPHGHQAVRCYFTRQVRVRVGDGPNVGPALALGTFWMLTVTSTFL